MTIYKIIVPIMRREEWRSYQKSIGGKHPGFALPARIMIMMQEKFEGAKISIVYPGPCLHQELLLNCEISILQSEKWARRLIQTHKQSEIGRFAVERNIEVKHNNIIP